MAAITASTIADALAQEYPECFSTVFRHFLLAQLIPVKPGSGKNDSFDVRFRSTQAARNATEGEDVTQYVADTFVPATGIWAEYDVAVKISGLSLAIAASSGGTSQEVKDQLGEALIAAYEELAVLLRTDAYTGSATSPQSLIGLINGATTGALGSTGTYYNINRGGSAPLPNFAGNVANGNSVLRPITGKLLDTSLTSVFNARGTKPDVMITTPAICDSLADQFNRRWTQEVTVGGRKIQLMGGYDAIVHNGVPVIRDPGAPANKVLGLDLSTLSFRQLAAVNDPFVMATSAQLRAMGTVDFPGGNVPFTVQLKPLSIGGDYTRYMAGWKGQLRCTDAAKNFVLGYVE